MRVRMLTTQYIAPDGITLHTYEEGDEYDVGTAEMPTDIAEALLDDKRAEEVKPKVSVHHVEEEEHAKPRQPGPRETK